ncbi:MAG: AAA family ATPase [Streptosporangiales bacterium]
MSIIYDIAAERALLGAVLANPDMAGHALQTLDKDAWWSGKHRALAAVISDMLTRGQPVDPTTVLSQVQANGMLSKLDGSFILDIYGGHHVPAHAAEYAARLAEIAAQRGLGESLMRVQQQMADDWERGDGIDVSTAVGQLRQACEEATTSVSRQDYQPTSLADLLAVQDSYNWLVPGLLERGERIVLTGAEGSGKSVLVSQFAAALCGGLHPFTAAMLGEGDRFLRVLVVDAENSEQQTRRRYRRLVRDVNVARHATGLGDADWKNNFFVEIRPEGLDLTKGGDLAWLEHAMSATAPDLLVLGPLYRLHAGDPNNEQLARELVHAIDSVRVRHNTAVITEAHAGHATDVNGDRRMRPSGSSLWLRWPEYGYGLRRSKEPPELTAEQQRTNRERPIKVDVMAWRGSREARSWPATLQHGRTFPWTPADPDYYDQSERIEEF